MFRGILSGLLASKQSPKLLHTLDNPRVSSIPLTDIWYGPASDCGFGYHCVAIHGNYAAVSAERSSYFDGTTWQYEGDYPLGEVHIYNVTTGELLYTLNNPHIYPTNAPVGQDTNANGGRDGFGLSIAISDAYVVIGAPYSNSASSAQSNAGVVYIYGVTTGELLYTLTNPNSAGTENNDSFGINVALSGNYLAIGKNTYDAGLDSVVYIYNVTNGTYIRTLSTPSYTYGNRFGFKIAADGDNLLVSDLYGGTSNKGVIYVYSISTGTLLNSISNNSLPAYSQFGWNITIGGNYCAAADRATYTVYVYDITTGQLLHTLNNPVSPDPSDGFDWFGYALAICKNNLIVGNPRFDGESYYGNWFYRSTEFSGAVHIYNIDSGELLDTIQNSIALNPFINSHDGFGYTLASSGNNIIVGCKDSNVQSAIPPGYLTFYGNGVYSSDSLILEQTVATQDETSYSITTSGPSSASIVPITYIAPNTTGLTVVPLENYIYSNQYAGSHYDDVVNITPPWGSVTYLGTTYSSVYYGTNGYITFGSYEAPSFYPTPPASPPLPKIYILAGQLVNDSIWVGTEGTTPNRVYRIVVNSVYDFYQETTAQTQSIRYEIRFYENDQTRIDVHQQNTPFGTPSVSHAGRAYIYKLTRAKPTLLHTLINPNVYGNKSYDRFGYALAMDGNHTITGAWYENNGDGAIYIHNATTGELVYTKTESELAGQSAAYGRSVDVSGNNYIVGAPYKDIISPEPNSNVPNAGKVWLYRIVNGTLVNSYGIENPNTNYPAAEYFGKYVAIDGNYAVIASSSKIRFYSISIDESDNISATKLPNDFNDPAPPFGYNSEFRADISGNYAIVGTPNYSGYINSQYYSSIGRVYIINVTTGVAEYTLSSPYADSYMYFGSDVAIDGNYAVVGMMSGSSSNSMGGRAYIYNVTTGSLVRTLYNPNVYGTDYADGFGSSVAIDGNYVIVGAYHEDIQSRLDTGVAYIFDLTTGELLHTIQKPLPEGKAIANGAEFGYQVDISGSKFVVGAPSTNTTGPVGLLGLNGVYSNSALIAAQNVATTFESSFKVSTSGPSSASIVPITYIAPDYTGLTQIEPLEAGVDDGFYNIIPPWGSITYLGTTYSSVYYGTNGYITFGAGSSTYYQLGPAIPNLPKIFIQGQDNANNGLWQGTEGTTPNRVHRVVVKSVFDPYEWTSNPNMTAWYEIRFYENDLTRIDVHQQEVPIGGEINWESGEAYIYQL